MNFKHLESKQKLSGSYYTPLIMAQFIAQWVLSHNPQSILEPSAGHGAFLDTINSILGPHQAEHLSVCAVDCDESACNVLREKSEHYIFNSSIRCANFYSASCDMIGERQFDAVIGNPPFIRYQYLSNEDQALIEAIYRDYGIKFTKHTNAWVPFIIQSIRLLNDGGVIGMLVPTEILHILYAKVLRTFLIKECSYINIAHVENVFSATVLQGVSFLFAAKKVATQDTCNVHFSTLTEQQIKDGNINILQEAPAIPANRLDGKWMVGLLTQEEFTVYNRAIQHEQVKRFSEIASADVGIVTGANAFFLVDQDTIAANGLAEFSHPAFGRSSLAKGLVYSDEDHEQNTAANANTLFLHFPPIPKENFQPIVQDYLTKGEELKYPERYKCSIRSPWYTVPSVWAASVAMLKRCHEMPRLIFNEKNAYTTDTAYRITLNNTSNLDAKSLVAGFVNSLTGLSAELEGRHYGGGVLELVPSEIESLWIPCVQLEENILRTNDHMLKDGASIMTVCEANDARILPHLDLSANEIRILQQAHLRIKDRRLRR